MLEIPWNGVKMLLENSNEKGPKKWGSSTGGGGLRI